MEVDYFNKCEDHRDYEEAISFDEFQDMLITEEHKDPDYVCDIPPSDYGYVLCEECDKLIQVE